MSVFHWRLATLVATSGDSDLANDHWRQAFQVLESMQRWHLHLSPRDLGFLEQLRQRILLLDDPAAAP